MTGAQGWEATGTAFWILAVLTKQPPEVLGRGSKHTWVQFPSSLKWFQSQEREALEGKKISGAYDDSRACAKHGTASRRHRLGVFL